MRPSSTFFCQKCPSLRPKKYYFEWPNQNSKTTFIVQTFLNYRPNVFYFTNLSLLGAILAIFQLMIFGLIFGHFRLENKSKYKMPKNSRRWPQIKKCKKTNQLYNLILRKKMCDHSQKIILLYSTLPITDRLTH